MSMFDQSRTGEYIDASIARIKAQHGGEPPANIPLPEEIQITIWLALKMSLALNFPEIAHSRYKDLRQTFDKTAYFLIPCLQTKKGQDLYDHMQDNLIKDLQDARNGKLPRD